MTTPAAPPDGGGFFPFQPSAPGPWLTLLPSTLCGGMIRHVCSDRCLCFARGCDCAHCAPIVVNLDALITDARKIKHRHPPEAGGR